MLRYELTNRSSASQEPPPPTLYGTRNFLTPCLHLSLSTARLIQSMPPSSFFKIHWHFEETQCLHLMYSTRLHLFETPVAVHRSARTAIPQDLNLPERRSENLKCRSVFAAVRFSFMLTFRISFRQMQVTNRHPSAVSNSRILHLSVFFFRWPTD